MQSSSQGDRGASSMSASRELGKRTRSWDVDASLDELVEWEALETFMSDLPSGDAAAQESRRGGSGLTEPAGGGVPVRSAALAGLPGSSRMGSADSFRSQGFASGLPGGLPGLPSQAWPGLAAGLAASPNLGALGGFAGGSTSMPAFALGGGGGGNAASLAQSLYAGWQQHSQGAQAAGSVPFPLQALPMERGVSWGSELLPFMTDDGGGGAHTGLAAAAGLMDPAALGGGAADGVEGFDGAGEESGAGRPMHKQRFVWTSELHRRFEAAVNTLGIDAAKPQAISQLMNCEGEGAPTRQNIKSHLQKYRLLMQKRARQGGGSGGDSATSSAAGDGPGADKAGASSGGDTERQPSDLQTELEQHIANQEMNLKRQMELQTKLHRHMLVQRQLQHQLEHCFLQPSDGGGASDSADRQRYHATLSLKNSLRERLTKHIMLQQEMLQHLDALVSNEATKPKTDAAGGTIAADEAQAAAAAVDAELPALSDGVSAASSSDAKREDC